MLRQLFVLLWFLAVSSLPVLAQNLLRNPDFEENTALPLSNGQVNVLSEWDIAVSSPDYLHEGGFPPDVGAYEDFFPFSGDAGMFFGAQVTGMDQFGEAIGQTLDEPLQKGFLYKFTAALKLHIQMNFSGGIHLYGLPEKPAVNPDDFQNAASLPGAVFLADIINVADVDNYDLFSTCFIAPANFPYFVISGFDRLIYIDQVSLEEVFPVAVGEGFLPADTTICGGDELIATIPFAVDAFTWSDEHLNLSRAIQNPGTYSLTVERNGCLAEDTVSLETELCVEPSIYIPNAFSPNFDGFNDEIGVFANVPFETFALKIFDRWGALLFSTTDPDEQWNGKAFGLDAPIGAYTLVLQYKIAGDPADGQEQITQSLTLVR
ncbi:MAG: gliding motility-associated C-terminal domain-containing protein [Bacteroidota bacterium]